MVETSQGKGILELQGVAKSFGETRALIDVDLSVPAGTIQGLLGPNGAGKTTLVRILATLLKPDTGRVSVAGVDVLRDPNTVRTLIGLAGQFAAVDETLTGRENLVMVGRLYRLPFKLAQRRAEDTLERLGLGDAADRQVRTYSGGMRRKLDLGASLVGEPRILLLDEPTTGLDPRTRLDVWQFIRELVGKGTTVLLTTQYLEEADRLADHIIVINRGRSVASGSPEELKSELARDALEVAVAPEELQRTVELLRVIGVGAPRVDPSAGTISIPVRNPVADLMTGVILLQEAAIVPRDIGLRRPSLDDVFLALTGASEGGS
jgi:daunorubicin resistance ABC transporter ATP-binding subunit